MNHFFKPFFKDLTAEIWNSYSSAFAILWLRQGVCKRFAWLVLWSGVKCQMAGKIVTVNSYFLHLKYDLHHVYVIKFDYGGMKMLFRKKKMNCKDETIVNKNNIHHHIEDYYMFYAQKYKINDVLKKEYRCSWIWSKNGLGNAEN